MLKTIFYLPLKICRRIYSILNPDSISFGRNWKMSPMKEYANDLIYQSLMQDKPIMIARLGSAELNCMVNYLGVSLPGKYKSVSNFIKGMSPAWWWNNLSLSQMHTNAGFFPMALPKIENFCKLMIEDMLSVDILGSWRLEERFFNTELINSKKVMLEDLEPFFAANPWTKALEGKKVLVVHPFAETIQTQYAKRDLLFTNGLLPEFELITLKAVQSIAGEKTPFSDWFKALDWMKKEIEKVDFDICILGCGAYGFPLAAHVKRIGKKAVHLGGVTQLLFGIKGKRWEQYLFYPYTNLFNEHWVRPDEEEKPKNAQIVEDACYW